MKKLVILTLLILFGFAAVSYATITEITPWKLPVTSQEAIANTDTLSTAGTSTDTLYVAGIHGIDNMAESITFSVTVTGISTNVVIRVVNGHSATSMGNVDEDGTDTTITSDGTYTITVRDVMSKGYFALLFVSEDGGTSAVLVVTAKVG